MAKTGEYTDFFIQSPEMKFDSRLLEKKIEQKVLTRADRESFLKSLPEESDFDFTSMDEVEKLEDQA